MKNVLLLMTVLAGITASANAIQEVLEYKVMRGTYSPAHVHKAGPASLKVNFKTGDVTLVVLEAPPICIIGKFCSQIQRAPLRVQLPIVSVKADSCGIRTITAQEDRRPVDGGLEVITVKDPSHMTCKTFVAVQPEATYVTTYVDRRNGKAIVNKSTMELAQTNDDMTEMSLAPPILVKYVQGTGFSPEPTVKTVYVDVTGRVISSVKRIRTNTVTNTPIAQLSEEALADLNTRVASIPVDAKLVDENENEPRCMDAPSTSIQVAVKGQNVVVYEFEGCHKLHVQEGYADQIYTAMLGLVALSK